MNTDIEYEIKRGRPKIYAEGYKQYYKDTKYMLVYYHVNKTNIEYEYCGKQTDKSHIREHQKSKKCMKCRPLDKIIV
jgi:hypothetical protein